MITVKTQPSEKDTLVLSASQKKRRMALTIRNGTPTDMETFMRTADAAAAKGFTTICLHLPWYDAEKQPLRYDFRLYDRQIAYVKAKGMDVILIVDLQRKEHTFDGERTPCDMVLNTDEFQYPFGGNTPFSDASPCDTVMISYASRKGTDYAVRFYSDAVRHFTARFGSTVYAAAPTFTPFYETEYARTEDFDYSPHMHRAFTAYLSRCYKKIGDLNADLGTDYKDFDAVPMPPSSDRGPLGVLFYQCRHIVLKTLIDRLAEAQKAAAPDTLFAVRFGSVGDDAVVRRCTCGFAELAEEADLVILGGGMHTDCAFDMDYIAGVLAGTGKAFANGIGGYDKIEQGDCTAEDYIEQGITDFRHNAAVLTVSDWTAGEAFDNYGYIFSTIAGEYITEKAPFCVSEDPASAPAAEISLKQLFEIGHPEDALRAYRQNTASGAVFGRIAVTDDLTHAFYPHSIEGKKEKKVKKPENPADPAVIFRRKARAAAKATLAVGAAIAILSAALAAKIITSDEDETDWAD